VSRDIPDTALRLVAAFFDAGTVRSAVDCARNGRVHLVKPPPWPVVAQVRGTEGYVVTVHYTAATGQLRGDCSCPAGGDCKHAAATALVAFAREGEHAARRLDSARQVVVGKWLADFGREERRDGAVATAERVVAYVIDARDGSVGITALQCARLKRGGLGNGAVIAALGDPSRGPPAWVDVDDLRRIAMLRAVARAAPHSARLSLARVHGELLRDLAASGHLFWESTRTAPLAYGPTVTDALRWQPSPDDPDACRLGLDSHLVIVPAHECHYIDPVASAIGPLDLGLPAELVQRLMMGPPVPAAMRETVERSLRPLMTAAAGPLWESPSSPGPERDAGEEPAGDVPFESMRPRMHASVAVDESAGPTVRIAGEAQYGDERFPLAEWDPDRPRPRDLVAEGRCHARLQSLVAGLPHRGGPASSLALLADARHVAHVIVPTLLGEGWDCELDPDFPHEAPMVGVEWVERLRPLAGSRGWFSVELGVCVAGRTIPLLPVLLQAIRGGQLVIQADGSAAPVGAGLNLRMPDGELVHVPADRVQRWLRPLVELELAGLDGSGELVVPAPVAAAIAGDARGRFAAPAELAAASRRLAALLELEPRREGTDFAGSLRHYQRIGLAWLRLLHDAGHGGLLADEMGLGKTVQVLAFLDGLRADGRLGSAPALVVAPRSVVGTWAREASRFTPGLRAIVHLGADRAERAASLTGAPLLVTSYQTLLRDIELFGEVAWTTIVFDEAQALKNASTQLRSAAASLRAGSRFCVTGTPIENHLGELWSQIDLAVPGLLGRRSSFDAIFRRPIEKYGEVAPLERLRQRIRPFLLRRTKEGVELDLPPRTEIVERIDLDTAQRDLYETLRLSLDRRVGEALVQQGIQGASMMILDALLVLRQCCCDPRLLKLPAARRVEGSAKLERLMDMLEELTDSGRSTLVFSQFTSMLRLIEKACAQAGISYVVLTGATRDRDEVIDRFQAGEASVFLISLKAGGVGLNLTRADTVIHYDPWWNPAAEAQATDRAHRIGQDKHVMVYKLVAQGTLEEAICTLQEEKRQLTAAALRGGDVTKLSAGDLEALYRRIV